jgi:hypothetical protein
MQCEHAMARVCSVLGALYRREQVCCVADVADELRWVQRLT